MSDNFGAVICYTKYCLDNSGVSKHCYKILTIFLAVFKFLKKVILYKFFLSNINL